MEGCKLVRIPVFLRDCRMCLGVPVKFTSQALASFKRQQEQSFQDQNTLAAEARETRRQELLEKIIEGQAPRSRSWNRIQGQMKKAKKPVEVRLPKGVRPVMMASLLRSRREQPHP